LDLIERSQRVIHCYEGSERLFGVLGHGEEDTPLGGGALLEIEVSVDAGVQQDKQCFVPRLAERGFVVYAPQNPYIGGDKFMAQHEKEQNPFLGWRGIRIMLDKPQVFLDQLKAILRASAEGNVAVMFPMVSNIKEVRLAKQLLRQAQDDLRAEGIPFDEKIRVGIMIEVPAAAVLAEDLAKEVDFLSIGTNDLIQYLLAVDRGNDVVSDLYQEFHPAVVRFLRRIIIRGKAAGAEVGMCGEMAGDPLATMLLVGLGLESFSVTPDMIPEIKKIIRSIHYSEAVHVAERVLTMDTEDEIRSFLATVMKQKFPELPVTSLHISEEHTP